MPASVQRVAVGGIFVVVMAGSTIYAFARPTSGQTATAARPIDGIPCDQDGQPAVHFHAHLDIFAGGRQVTVPAGIGIPSSGSCLYWMHTHDTSGVIHIEVPAGRTIRSLKLGDFLAIWGKGPTTTSTMAGISIGPNRRAIVIVDGRRYTGDPDGIVLTAHELITLAISPPDVSQPDFQFRQGF
jgi:hypothetical protein